MAPKLNDPSLFKQDVCYVNGEWRPAKSGKTFKVTDPGSGELVGTSPEFTAEDTQSAITAAADALPSFRTTTGRERAKLLRRWYDEVVANAEDIATLITWENGKPLADARGEATYAANFFEWFSEEAPRIYGDTIPSSVPTNRIVTYREPVGVCGLITPWNFPAAMITRKVAPALAAGCTVVCKAPGETPFTALALAELAHRAGIPKGVVNIVTALENTVEVGLALTTSPAIKKVSFTGSTGVGSILMKQSADSLKKLSMELGGNAPFIVFDDADLDAAVAGAIASKFRSSGQTCVCANRIYVQSGIYDQFVHKFTEMVQGFRVGHGFDGSITHGPLIHDRAVSKVNQHVRDAEQKGGKVTVGGQALPDLGSNFFQPTVIRDMTVDMAIATEETFGPVAGVFPFETEAEVVKMANQADVGLAGYFFSRDLARVYRVAEALEVGMVGVNTGIISDPASPFGGVKQSGFGREGSKYGIEEYQTIKTITFGGMGKPLQA
ncbi:succinate semialdehyde dehydrogenase NADP+ linked [Amphichorda felina]